MRTFLLLAFLTTLASVGCASSGRTRTVDAHVGGTDAGPRTDTSAPHDTGARADTGGGGDVDTGPITMPDSGGVVRVDAFVPDTGTPAPDTGCANDAQCSDGIGCNGVERCVAGACVPPTGPLDCSDGLACTTDTCVEPGMCVNTSTCAGGGSCQPTGCVTTCSESPCRILSPQCGCATGQACYPQGATRVCATAGTGTSGTACTNNSSCAAGYACLNVSTGTTAQNVCTRACSTDADCGGGLCLYQLDDGTGTPVPGLTLCTHPCNAVTQVGCPAGTACTLFNESTGAMRAFTDCTAPVGVGGEEASCIAETECSAGRACIDTSDGLGTACHHWCNVATGAGCTGGRTCLSFTTPIVVNGVTYGVCSF